jgi:hypothetical protein
MSNALFLVIDSRNAGISVGRQEIHVGQPRDSERLGRI